MFSKPATVVGRDVTPGAPRHSLLFNQTVQRYKPKCNTIHACKKYMYGLRIYLHVTQKRLMALCSDCSNKFHTNRNIYMESTNIKSLCL